MVFSILKEKGNHKGKGIEMLSSTYQLELNAPRELVWQVITDYRQYHWRGEIATIQVLEENLRFMEIEQSGFATIFDIVAQEAPSYYELKLENKHFTGRWQGKLEEIAADKTRLIIDYRIKMKHWWLQAAAFFCFPLRRMQKRYGEALRRCVEDGKSSMTICDN